MGSHLKVLLGADKSAAAASGAKLTLEVGGAGGVKKCGPTAGFDLRQIKSLTCAGESIFQATKR